jgi:hypothetical protein
MTVNDFAGWYDSDRNQFCNRTNIFEIECPRHRVYRHNLTSYPFSPHSGAAGNGTCCCPGMPKITPTPSLSMGFTDAVMGTEHGTLHKLETGFPCVDVP